eukprot:5365371-Amphidinium_carterae.2
MARENVRHALLEEEHASELMHKFPAHLTHRPAHSHLKRYIDCTGEGEPTEPAANSTSSEMVGSTMA